MEKVKLKEAKGITLVALVITVIILLILAGVAISLVIGENGLITKSKAAGGIATREGIRESLQMEVARSYDDNVTLDVQKLKNNIMEEMPEAKIIGNEFPIVVIIKGYAYEINEKGKVEYLGKEEELIEKTIIEASPKENTTPELVQKVKITVKTLIGIEDENIKVVYAWSNNEKTKPGESEYIKATLTGNPKDRTAQIASNATEEGNYYLWVKVIIGEKEIEKTYGPYAIKDHTTLVSTGYQQSSSIFLGGTIKRNQIESVTIGNSLGSHTKYEENCWDVSANKNEKYLAWYEDKDGDGYYEVTIAGEGGVVANSNSSYLFSYIGYNGDDTTVFYGLENLDTGLVTNMGYMFDYCNNATSIDVSKFNTSNVTNMYDMFYCCSSLTSLDVSKFDTSNVTNMYDMFYCCSSLTSLDVSKFDTSNVINMNKMFYYCRSLTDLDVSNFNTSNVTNMYDMFYCCSSLTSLDVSKFDTSNVTNMCGMFSSCSNLTSLDVSKFDTSNVTDMGDMFYYCSSLTSLDVSKFDTSNVTDMCGMFYCCSSLTSLDVSKFDTSNVTNMYDMFYYCSSLTDLDLSNFNTSNVIRMSWMFYQCKNLRNLNLSGFDTTNITSMSYLFDGCKSLENLDISNFNISNVTSWDSMFSSLPRTIKIKTNSNTATWLKEKFTNITDANIELVS